MEEIGWGKMIKTTLSGYNFTAEAIYYENYWENRETTSSNQSKVG